MDDVKKIPHQPERFLNRWAVSLGHELFRIEEVGREDGSGLPYYKGPGLAGQEVWTRVATVLTQDDNDRLEGLT